MYFNLFLTFLCSIILIKCRAEGFENYEEDRFNFPAWPEKRASSNSFEPELFVMPGLRGLRGKRFSIYSKRVPMMSLKGLRGKRTSSNIQNYQ